MGLGRLAARGLTMTDARRITVGPIAAAYLEIQQGVVLVLATDYDALRAEAEALRAQRNKMAENHNSILVTEVCPESRSVEEHIIDADSVRALWRLMRGYREQIEALRAENGHWKGMHASSMAMRMSAEFERDELRTELNEALGLLRELRAFTLDHDD